MTAALRSFLHATLNEPHGHWTEAGIQLTAPLAVPDVLLGRRGSLLRADANALWAKWFIESICDPEPLVRKTPGYGPVFQKVLPFAKRVAGDAPEVEIRNLATQLATLVLGEVTRRAEMRRARMNRDIRLQLLDIHGPTVRCWICGHAFSDWAVARFAADNLDADAPSLPTFVDFAKPSGLNHRDLQIEIDHVLPVAKGGREGDNLRLACGWCNGAKSSHTTLYDVSGTPYSFAHPRLGTVSVPRPLWVVRNLALFNRCEWTGSGGCPRTTRDTELTVEAWNPDGALTPGNLRIVCPEHHHLGPDRLVAREKIERARRP